MSTALSILYLSFNEEDVFGQSLESIKSIADEIVVIDSGSTDLTVQIAESAGAHVYHRRLKNWGEQRNWGLKKCQHPWILVVDCDEVCTTELIESLKEWKQSEHHEQHPYSFKRVHFYKGKRMNFSGLQNDYVVRLLPKGVKYEELNVHEKVRASSKRLKGNMLHYTYKNAEHWEQKFRTYAKRQALDYEKKVGRIGPYYLNVKPSWRFFRHYIIKGGIFDGSRGFEYALWMYRAVKWRYIEVNKLRIK
jgi:glycosyltransferase involved in cell wall biosynthesis